MHKEKKIAIFLFGLWTAGKGTQAKLLADRLGMYHFTTSHEGKEYMKTHHDEQTSRQMELYSSGLLFEPEWTSRVVLERTKEIFEKEKGIIYDGTPRTLYEAQSVFPVVLDLFEKENVYILFIEISEEESQKRTLSRLICDKDSRHIYIRSDQLKPGVKCQEGDGVLEVRDLDNLETLKTRTNEYKTRTMPAIKYMENLHSVKKINGEQSIEDVHKDIIKALEL
jgi:adenylate kinase